MNIFKYFLVLSILIMVAGTSVFYLKKYKQTNKVPEEISPSISQVPASGKIYFNQQLVDQNKSSSVLSTGRDYYENLVKDLKKEVENSTDIKTLINKKVVMYHWYPFTELITDRDKRSEKVRIAYDAYYDLYQESKISAGDSSSIWLRAKILNSLQLTYQTECYIYQDLDQSKWSKDPLYIEIINKYPKNRQLASQVFLLKLLDREDYKDNLYTGTKISIIARILDNFSKDLSNAEIQAYVLDLKSMTAEFSSLPKTKNFSSDSRRVMLPNIYYLYGMSVLSKFDLSIDKNNFKSLFQKRLVELENMSKGVEDPANMSLLWLRQIYLKFIFETNGGVVDKEVEDTVDKIIVSSQNLSKGELYASAITFFNGNSQNVMGGWDSIRKNMIEVAKKSDKMKTFMESYGVKI